MQEVGGEAAYLPLKISGLVLHQALSGKHCVHQANS